MNKLLGLFLFALAFLAPNIAQAAARFAVCSTTCTWDNSSTAMWSTSTGGATGASAPVAGDDVTLDGATCVGGTTCTITTFAGTIPIGTVTWGACTASTTGCIIAANTNNTNFTISASGLAPFNGSGTGTRKWLAGTGTYALTSNGANLFNMGTTTNDQGSVFSGATWTVSGSTTSTRTWAGGNFSYGPTTWNANSSGGSIFISGTNTFSSLTLGAPQAVNLSTTQTITGALTTSGSSSSALVLLQSSGIDSPVTFSLGAASAVSWISLRAITTSGAAALTGTNCFDMGRNTFANAGTCTPPSVGGGGGGRIIGG